MQLSKLNENINLLHFVKSTPKILQLVKTTLLKPTLPIKVIEKLQFSNTQSSKLLSRKSLFVKLQLINVHFENSRSLNVFSE
jgi:hypothetical protein